MTDFNSRPWHQNSAWLRQQQSAGNSCIEGRQHGTVFSGQFEKVAVGQLAGCSCERGEAVGADPVFEQLESHRAGCLESGQGLPCGGNVDLEGSLDCNAHESQFRNRAGAERGLGTANRLIPQGGSAESLSAIPVLTEDL